MWFNQNNRWLIVVVFVQFVMFAVSNPARAQVGTWTQSGTAPDFLEAAILLTDGTVILHSANTYTDWYKLTPDSQGNYVDGKFTQIASNAIGRLYGQTAVLQNGDFFFGGGEYLEGNETDNNTAEVYDPVLNIWKLAPDSLYPSLGDTGSSILPNGLLLCSDWTDNNTDVYNQTTNSWAAGPVMNGTSGDEETWVTLSDGSILNTYETAQRYIPSENIWQETGKLPLPLVDDAGEIGPTAELYDGRVMAFGATGNTEFYSLPSSVTGAGTWAKGPPMPNGLISSDEPSCVEVDGKVLTVGTPTDYGDGTFLEFDPVANTFATLPLPPGIDPPLTSFTARMLALPNGQVLLTAQYNCFWVYTPTGGPQTGWKPSVKSVTLNTDGSYEVSGTQLNGLTNGASYGDEDNPYTHYPIVYLEDSLGNVHYARTFNFSQMNPSAPGGSETASFTLPPGLANGTYNLFVSASGVSSAAFQFNTSGAPIISSFSPASGPIGASVKITGMNFSGATSVTFAGAKSVTPTSVSATSLTAVVPKSAITGPVSVTNSKGAGISAGFFTVFQAPTIKAFIPSRGPVGTTINVGGTNLTSATLVTFTGGATAVPTAVTSTSLTVVVPSGSTTGPITITGPGGSAASSASFTVVPVPTITSFSPASGIIGTTINIVGTNLKGATLVTFTGGKSAVPTTVTQTTAKVIVPAGASTGPISIDTAYGVGTSSSSFTVILSPTITSFTPVSGPIGTAVTITGKNLASATLVTFGGKASAVPINISATSATAVVPNGAVTGPVSITTSGGTATVLGPFTVVGVPTVTSFSPSSGKIGAQVQIVGTNIGTATLVTFAGGKTAVPAAVKAGSCTVVVPSGAVTGTISIKTQGGTATSANPFTVIQVPTITSFSPTFGPIGTSVTVLGTDLAGTTLVTFTGEKTAVPTSVSATSVIVAVPVGVVTGTFTLTAPSGTVKTSSAFTVILSPKIISFSPTTGPIGTLIKIVGTNLAGAASVKFTGGKTAIPSSVTPSSASVIVPAGAETGTFTITTLGGTVASPNPFTVN